MRPRVAIYHPGTRCREGRESSRHSHATPAPTTIFFLFILCRLTESGLIGKLVATVDNLPRAHVAERIRPLGRLDDPFRVDAQDASGEYWINTGNYERYDALVEIAMNADLNTLAELYRRYYPLFQDAYVNLGYRNLVSPMEHQHL